MEGIKMRLKLLEIVPGKKYRHIGMSVRWGCPECGQENLTGTFFWSRSRDRILRHQPFCDIWCLTCHARYSYEELPLEEIMESVKTGRAKKDGLTAYQKEAIAAGLEL